jgi:hypothetical protein
MAVPDEGPPHRAFRTAKSSAFYRDAQSKAHRLTSAHSDYLSKREWPGRSYYRTSRSSQDVTTRLNSDCENVTNLLRSKSLRKLVLSESSDTNDGLVGLEMTTTSTTTARKRAWGRRRG